MNYKTQWISNYIYENKFGLEQGRIKEKIRKEILRKGSVICQGNQWILNLSKNLKLLVICKIIVLIIKSKILVFHLYRSRNQNGTLNENSSNTGNEQYFTFLPQLNHQKILKVFL